MFNIPPKLILCDKNNLILDGMQKMIETETGFNIVATATDGELFLQAAQRFDADIGIIGWEMPFLNGSNVLTQAQNLNLRTRIIVYSARDIAYTAMLQGAAGFLSKRAQPKELLNILDAVTKGNLIFPYTNIAKQDKVRQILTRRERQLLELLTTGANNSKIADQAHLSINTVKFHLKNIYQKLNVNNRTEAVLAYKKFDL